MSKTTTDLGAEPTLRGRLTRAAAASGGLPPFVFPGAAALILPVSLPVKTARQRRAALPFAVEPYLAEPVEQAALALGPQLASGDWLCVAANRDRLRDMTAGTHAPGPVLPDTLAVPLPNRADAWAVWCGPQSTHLRMADGTGMATTPDHFPNLWRVFGAPPIELKYGALPPDIATTHEPEALPALDPALLQIDLRSDDGRGQAYWVGRLGLFAALAALATSLAQTGLLWTDAQALDRIAQTRTALVQERMDRLGLPLDASAPARLIRAELAARGVFGVRHDSFLSQLATMFSAVPLDAAVSLRNLNYDAGTGRLILLVEAKSLDALQRVETALLQAGLPAQSGAATRSEAGAEMQIVLTEGA